MLLRALKRFEKNRGAPCCRHFRSLRASTHRGHNSKTRQLGTFFFVRDNTMLSYICCPEHHAGARKKSTHLLQVRRLLQVVRDPSVAVDVLGSSCLMLHIARDGD